MLLPKISIITPTYNQGRYVEESILSVINQHYTNLEYIIIDGGSTDNTVEILEKYSSKITYWISEPDKGQTDALNKGLSRATGTIINWLNSDDYLEPGVLQKIAAEFSSEKINAITTIVKSFENDGSYWRELTETQNSAVNYLCKTLNNQPGTFFRKKLWDKYFPLPVQLHFVMDQYLWLCYWLDNDLQSFKVLWLLTVNFRRHDNSKTILSKKKSIFKNLGEPFFNEYNLLFWSFFTKTLPEKAGVLVDYFSEDYDYKTQQVNFPDTINCPNNICHSIFNLYLLELIKEDYKCGFTGRLNTKYLDLDIGFLSADDILSLKKMKLKTFSNRILKAYRSIYWFIKNHNLSFKKND